MHSNGLRLSGNRKLARRETISSFRLTFGGKSPKITRGHILTRAAFRMNDKMWISQREVSLHQSHIELLAKGRGATIHNLNELIKI